MATDLERRSRRQLAVWILVAIAAAAFAPWLGGMGLDVRRVLAQDSPDYAILMNLRIPRTLLALITGAALAGSGAMFQALLRDALATPSSLGVSAAASLGAVFAISFASGEDSSAPLVWLAAVAGAAITIAFVAALGRSRRFSPFTLLLTGIAINGVCASLVLLLHSLAGITKSFQITHWLMGGIDAVRYPVLGVLALVVAPMCWWMMREARVWNVMSYGDVWAAGRGIEARSVTWKGFAVGALLVGVTTAITGPISFVGLIVPHLLRRLVGPDHRLLMPASIFGGGAFLVLCDLVSRSILAPVEIPVGVTTALLGGPFFVWLLWSR
jgi:iron complex transport system permease protein